MRTTIVNAFAYEPVLSRAKAILSPSTLNVISRIEEKMLDVTPSFVSIYLPQAKKLPLAIYMTIGKVCP